MDRQQQFVSAKCSRRFWYVNASRTVDQSDATYSICLDNWKGESKEAKKINKINVIPLLEESQYFNVSVGIKGNKLKECVKENKLSHLCIRLTVTDKSVIMWKLRKLEDYYSM